MFFHSCCHEMRSVFVVVVVVFLTVSGAVLRGSIIFNGVCRWIFRGKGIKYKTSRQSDVISLSRVVVR